MTESEAFDYLVTRASQHGVGVTDLLEVTPDSVADSYVESAEFWQGKDVSHIYPQSEYPWLADDPKNIMPEDPGTNRARGAEVMTDAEIEAAIADNEADAAEIDADFADAVGDLLFA